MQAELRFHLCANHHSPIRSCFGKCQKFCKKSAKYVFYFLILEIPAPVLFTYTIGGHYGTVPKYLFCHTYFYHASYIFYAEWYIFCSITCSILRWSRYCLTKITGGQKWYLHNGYLGVPTHLTAVYN